MNIACVCVCVCWCVSDKKREICNKKVIFKEADPLRYLFQLFIYYNRIILSLRNINNMDTYIIVFLIFYITNQPLPDHYPLFILDFSPLQ